ncbi:hypothetical protein [Anaeromyxobacter oryzae]|uniref:Uncharacterized protein n=1 Tax=Anaeromyxobacter oryzae TaxID=2918170 RepID=A0ABN6MNF2_9BACT|nr:hypothetical protein [Anaeromyxobacter oryzae]BDG01155.1 hypothetical protein AMOR_01510 [Anaeromyxobacter oryzae]
MWLWPRTNLTLVSPLSFLECAQRIERLVKGPPRAEAGQTAPPPFEGAVEGRRFRVRRRVRFRILKEPSQPWLEGEIEPGSGESVIRAKVRGSVAPGLLVVAVVAVPAILLLVNDVAMCLAAWKLGPNAPFRCAPDATHLLYSAFPVALTFALYAATLAWRAREVRLALRLLESIARPAVGPRRSLVPR